jgi:hypothetical protein
MKDNDTLSLIWSALQDEEERAQIAKEEDDRQWRQRVNARIKAEQERLDALEKQGIYPCQRCKRAGVDHKDGLCNQCQYAISMGWD